MKDKDQDQEYTPKLCFFAGIICTSLIASLPFLVLFFLCLIDPENLTLFAMLLGVLFSLSACFVWMCIVAIIMGMFEK